MFQAEVGIPYHLMQPVFASGAATGLAAVAEFNYAGANTTVTIWAVGTKLTIIPAHGISVMGTERIEVLAIQKYTGSTQNFNLIQLYQRADAHETAQLNLPFIVLKPGESIAIRIFNRAPAAQATVNIAIQGFTIAQNIYDQYTQQQRKGMEQTAGVY